MTYAVELLPRVVKVVKMSTVVTTFPQKVTVNKLQISSHKQSGATKRKVLLSVCQGIHENL